MSHFDVAHSWFHQKSKRKKDGNMFFQNQTIYSYGLHFPIAVLWNGVVLFNETNYSISTSKHQSLTMQSIDSQSTPIIDIGFRIEQFLDFNGISKTPDNIQNLVKDSINKKKESIDTYIGFEYRARKKTYVNDIYRVQREIRDIMYYLSFDKRQLTKKDKEYIYSEPSHLIGEDFLEKKRDKIREYQKKEREREKKKLNNDIENFRKRLKDSVVSKLTYLRVNNNNVETSKGFKVNVEQAKKWIKTCKLAIRQNQSIFPKQRIDGFNVQYIDNKGNFKAGCHFIEWNEIANIARELEMEID